MLEKKKLKEVKLKRVEVKETEVKEAELIHKMKRIEFVELYEYGVYKEKEKRR